MLEQVNQSNAAGLRTATDSPANVYRYQKQTNKRSHSELQSSISHTFKALCLSENKVQQRSFRVYKAIAYGAESTPNALD